MSDDEEKKKNAITLLMKNNGALEFSKLYRTLELDRLVPVTIIRELEEEGTIKTLDTMWGRYVYLMKWPEPRLKHAVTIRPTKTKRWITNVEENEQQIEMKLESEIPRELEEEYLNGLRYALGVYDRDFMKYNTTKKKGE